MTPADRTSAADGHILISGTGRAGTTLLVQYFTALGFDTGFSDEQARANINPVSHAGLEHQLSRASLPYVSKSPTYANKLHTHLESGTLRVRACIVPVRDLREAAESRRRVYRAAEALGKEPTQQPGALTFQARKNPARQEEKLAKQFHRLVQTLVERDIAMYFLAFPRFTRDHAHLFERLGPLLKEHGVTAAESAAALEQVVDASLINDFSRPDPPTAD